MSRQSLAVCADANGVVQVEMSRPAIDEVMVRELAATCVAVRDP